MPPGGCHYERRPRRNRAWSRHHETSGGATRRTHPAGERAGTRQLLHLHSSLFLTAMKTVLIADDKATSRELVRTVLEKDGYSVMEAADGIEALRNARESMPDVIILDLQMPGLDGFAVLQELRKDQRFAATPIMALTASAMQGHNWCRRKSLVLA